MTWPAARLPPPVDACPGRSPPPAPADASPGGSLPSGLLAPAEPIHRFLKSVLPAGCRPVGEPLFEASVLVTGGAAALFRDLRTGTGLVGKFYGLKPVSAPAGTADALRREFMERERDSLARLRALGFDRPPLRVPEPFGCSEALGFLLVQQFVEGPSLQTAIERAATGGGHGGLTGRVAAVAAFLAALHGRTGRAAARELVADPIERLRRVGEQLAGAGLLEDGSRARLEALAGRWDGGGVIRAYDPVLIHGDATPPHFILGEDPSEVTAIDLERLWPGDPAADLGSLAAELKHLFWRFGGDPWAGEPYVRALYAAYRAAATVPDPALTERGRFHQGIQQLRIARNAWLADPLRRDLIADGLRCLDDPDDHRP